MKLRHQFHHLNLRNTIRGFRSSRRITDRNDGNRPEVVGQVQNFPYIFLFKGPDPTGSEAEIVGRKEQVLDARSCVLDAVEVRAPLAVARGDAVVGAGDDHKGRTYDEADELLF